MKPAHLARREVRGVNTAFSRFRSFSIWAYICLFGALWGYAAFGAAEKGLLAVWVAFALLGSALVGLKNRQVPDPRVRRWMYLSDLLITGVLLALVNLAPATPTPLGLLRGAIILILALVYFAVYTGFLYRGKLVALTL